jgi:hypothetical protein
LLLLLLDEDNEDDSAPVYIYILVRIGVDWDVSSLESTTLYQCVFVDYYKQRYHGLVPLERVQHDRLERNVL